MDMIAFLKENWMIIAQAPATFMATAILFVAFGFAVSARFYAARVELAEARVADYKDKLEGKTPDEAAKQIEDLNKRLTALEPLSLSWQAQESMRSILSENVSSVRISLDIASNENRTLSEQMEAVFVRAGWRVETASFLSGGPDYRPISGIGLRLGTGLRSGSGEQQVRRALAAAALTFDVLNPLPDAVPHIPVEIVLSMRRSNR